MTSPRTFSKTEAVTVTDTPSILKILMPVVSDAITVAHAPTVDIQVSPAVSDAITLAEVFAIVPVLLIPPTATVAENGSGTASQTATSATSIDLTTLTVDAGSNLELIVSLHTAGFSTTDFAVNWDADGTPQAMTLVTQHNNAGYGHAAIFRLSNPTPGNKTLRATWTTSSNAVIGAIAYSGANQANGINAAHNVDYSATTSSPSFAITSDSKGATFGFLHSTTALGVGANSQTQIWLTTLTTGTYGLGGASNTHSWTLSDSIALGGLGVHVIPEVNPETVIDRITVAESIALELSTPFNGQLVSASDAITVSDSPTILIPILVPEVSDSISVSTQPIVNLLSYVAVSDAVTAADAPVLNLLSYISTEELVTVGEIAVVDIRVAIDTSDAITVNDSPLIFIPILTPEVADAVTATDTPTVNLLSYVSTTDAVTVAEATNFLILLSFLTSESIVMGESAVVDIQVRIDSVDAVTVTDTPSIFIPILTIEQSQAVIIGETSQTQIVCLIDTTSAVTVADSGTLTVSAPQVVVSDSVTVADVPNIVEESVVGNLSIAVSDSVSVSDTPAIFLPILTIQAVESVSVVTATEINLLSFISVSDQAAVDTTPALSMVSFPSVQETVTISDSPNPNLLSFISASDSTSVTDDVFVSLPGFTVQITVVEHTATGEEIRISSVWAVNVIDAINVEDIDAAGLIYHPVGDPIDSGTRPLSLGRSTESLSLPYDTNEAMGKRNATEVLSLPYGTEEVDGMDNSTEKV